MTIDLQLHICRSGRPTPARGRLVLILLTACLAGFLTAGCAAPRLEDAGPSPTPQPAPTAMPTATPSPTAVPTMVPTVVATPTAAPTAAYQPDMAMFATVWQTVNDEFFDPAMNGVDWQAMREEYEPLVAGATDAESYYRLLNAMLFELGVSHLGALPAEMSSQLDPLTFAQGDLGFDVRFLDNAIVVTLVEPGSPAARAGFKPGFVITEIGGKTPDELDQESIMPPLNERDQRGRIAQLVRAQALGEPGQTVTVRYLDAKDQLGDITLTFAARDARETEVMPDLPPAYVTLDVRRLAPAIGYIRFSGFLSGIEEDVSAAIDEMADTRALIIDLRGNPGGVFPVRKALAEKLVGERVAFWRYKLRDDLDTIYLDPQPDAYQGDVVILIDELSASSAEEFAGGLQDIGRATIVGNRSPGRCLIANVVPLTDGAFLVYPHGQSQTASGAILEYYGVTPDVEVALDRASLLAGRDPQLEAALAVAAGQ